ncbi:MAG: CoA-binding protein [Coleofasciculus sp. Co-bin14]|nr:CoA-binding protein [Coleofasciculus sp. Co-bin14]
MVWTQLGVYDEASAQKALDSGLNVMMDVCIKVEYMRLRVG